MKFSNLLLFAILLCLFNVVAVYAVPLTDIDNKHNLRGSKTSGVRAQLGVPGDGSDQVCIFCHTPHSAVPDTPLWNRSDPAFGAFPLYAQPLVIAGTLGSDPVNQVARSQYTDADASAYPNGASRLCLSCHDGVTAIGLLNDGTSINMVGGTNLNEMGSTAVVDLSTSHPISFVYDGAVLNDLLTYAGSGYGPGSYALPVAAIVDTPLDSQNRMQCTTCHDPHEDTSNDVNYDSLPFWRHQGGNASYDEVCNSCHKDAGFVPGGPSGDHQLP